MTPRQQLEALIRGDQARLHTRCDAFSLHAVLQRELHEYGPVIVAQGDRALAVLNVVSVIAPDLRAGETTSRRL